MGERRQAHRRETITVALVNGKEFVAEPLHWMERNDLGNEILRQSQEMVNESMRLYVDAASGAPQVELMLDTKLNDFPKILMMAYPGTKRQDYEGNIYYEDFLELIYAALDVNSLTHLRRLVDPNFQSPEKNGGENSSGVQEMLDIQKKQFTSDSSTQDSIEIPSTH
jgi:hypothetical protein